MPAAITLGVVASILAGYGLVMLRRRARLRDLASELGGEYLDEGWTKPGGVTGPGFTIRVEIPRRTFRTNVEVPTQAPGPCVIDPGFFASPFDWSHMRVPATISERAFVVHVSLPGYASPDDTQREAFARWLARGSAHRVHSDMLAAAGITRLFVSPDAVTTSLTGIVANAERLRRTVDVLSRVAGGGRGR
jgi:hypothetical protein